MNKIFLGIESTAHTFGVAVVNEKGKILSDARAIYKTEKGGIIPADAAKHHKEVKDKVLEEALRKAKIKLKDIDVIAFSKGPGLAPCLIVGRDFAKELALKLKKPLVGVNHIKAHLDIGKFICKVNNPLYVFVSGANTQQIFYKKGYRILSETLDIGLGNALDKFGRDIGLGFPAGPEIEKLAKKGSYVELPYTVKGMDVAFSGIVTEAFNKFKKGFKKEDLCFSLQETCFAMLTETVERALAFTNKKEVLLIGGVAANKRLCNMLNKMCKDRKAKFYAVPIEYAGDQAAMIALSGIENYKKGKIEDVKTVDIKPRWRIDEI